MEPDIESLSSPAKATVSFATQMTSLDHETIKSSTVFSDNTTSTVQPVFDSSYIIFHFVLYKVTVPVCYTLISVIGLAGNSLVVYVIISAKVLHTKVNILLLNLAVGDIIFLFLSVPLMTYHYAAANWNLGEFLCSFGYFILYLNVYVTMYTMVAVAFIRFITVAHPRVATKMVSYKKISAFIFLLWLLMMVANFPIFYIYRLKTFNAGQGYAPYTYCAMTDPHRKHFVVVFFTLTYVVPLTLICAFYLLLLHFLRRQRLQSSLRQSRGGNTRADRRTRATGILLRVVLAFALCWLPLHVHTLVAHFGHQPRHMAYEVYRVFCHILAYSGSIMNPFVYNFYSREFRNSFVKIYKGIERSVAEDQVSTCNTKAIKMSEVKRNATSYSGIQTSERNRS